LPFPSSFKVKLLRQFGATVGSGVVIKPDVNIKYPWFLEIGDDCWIGEGVWVDNLAKVTIGSNVVLSQGAYLLTGSHDYTKESFDLMLNEIILEDGVWIGAKATVCPGVVCKSHAVLAVGSVATKELKAFSVYQGNPAVCKRERKVGGVIRDGCDEVFRVKG
jgi:putative colanic acid biosynthesis acetyltransferase WcaF